MSPSEKSAPRQEFKPVALDAGATRGAMTGAAAGAVLGLAYGYFPKVTSLALGPLPGVFVGLVAGTIAGGLLGAVVGAIGRPILTRRAGGGAAVAIAIVVLGRLADDTGQAIDKFMDILCASAVWGVFGAVIGATLFGPEAESSSASEPSSDSKPGRE